MRVTVCGDLSTASCQEVTGKIHKSRARCGRGGESGGGLGCRCLVAMHDVTVLLRVR